MEDKGTDKKTAEKAESVPANVVKTLLDKVSELERRDEENQKQLKMLYEVADKGRVHNYETSRSEKKPSKIQLGVYGGGIIVGWRTVKDERIFHPTTGLQTGEVQEYELLVLQPDGDILKKTVSGYPAFSNARYDERIEAEIVGRKEDFQGNISFDLQLSDGRKLELDARFAN